MSIDTYHRDVGGETRGSIQQLEEKFGNFFLAVLIRRAHLLNERKYGKVEGRCLSLLHFLDGSLACYALGNHLVTSSFLQPSGHSMLC